MMSERIYFCKSTSLTYIDGANRNKLEAAEAIAVEEEVVRRGGKLMDERGMRWSGMDDTSFEAKTSCDERQACGG